MLYKFYLNINFTDKLPFVFYIVEILVFLWRGKKWRGALKRETIYNNQIVHLSLEHCILTWPGSHVNTLLPEEGPWFTCWVSRVFQNTSIQWKHFPAYTCTPLLDLPFMITLEKKENAMDLVIRNMNEAGSMDFLGYTDPLRI